MIENIEVQGLEQLEKQLLELELAAGKRVLRKASREAMAGVQFVMARGAGYDPDSPDGEHMRDSIKITTKIGDKKNGGRSNAVVARVGPAKKHSQKAIAQEYGTAKQSADPFMRSALYENRHHVLDTFRSVLADSIRKALKKQGR